MNDKRKLDFQSTADLSDDIRRLQRGHTKVGGTWTLAQVCQHCATPLGVLRIPVDRTEPTPEELEMRKFLDGVIAARGIPDGRPTPPGTEPAADPGPEAVDAFVDGLKALDAYPHPYVMFARFGPVPADAFRQFVLVHTAHHLNFFRPTA